MREIDNSDAALLLKAMRGSAQKKYHDNLSKRLAAVILDELECMGLVRIKDISDAARRIFKVILSFGKNQEIKVPAGLDRIFE